MNVASFSLFYDHFFNQSVEKLGADFEDDIRGILIKRWDNIIAIKKEHIKQELAEIKTTGLKPKYVKRVYEQFNMCILCLIT